MMEDGEGQMEGQRQAEGGGGDGEMKKREKSYRGGVEKD